LDRVLDPLVRADDPEREERPAVVAPRRVAREDGMRDDAQRFGVGELRELLASALAVDDDALEAAEQPPPEISLGGRPAGEEVVRREDQRRLDAEEPVV